MRNVDVLDPEGCRFYGACVISALEYMHARHIIYRDLKPENIVLSSTGYAKVVDFGFAKRISARTFTLCGTPEYLAPEQIQMHGHDQAADWWACGVLIYEMAMGAVPFCFVGGQPDFEMNPTQMYGNILNQDYAFHLPTSLDPLIADLVLKLLTADPMHRFGRLTGGAQDVKLHEFFTQSNFDWEGLHRGELPPAYTPSVHGDEDLSNFEDTEFDHSFLREPAYDFPFTEWDYDF